ncbi:alpha/beta hydrolase family protein [Symmachiella dynata]|uniref:alpha/beta hydrolase family protein n=1 Tax=Symmachiella dynata TaxID=2527995 RepID=UPI00118A8AE5|nr:alpha/beta hydrolase family protein [Symmachiella dynata]QDT47410.1 Abhydrolase family protein [Symmachiella dynata]
MRRNVSQQAGIAIVLCVFLHGSAAMSAETEKTSPKKTEVQQGIAGSFKQLRERFEPELSWNATTPAEHAEWRKSFRDTVVRLLGRMPEKVPLNVVWAEKKEFELFTRHKVYIRSEAEYWVPVYYYVPHKHDEKLPAIVCLHGHSGIEPYIASQRKESIIKSTKRGQLDYAVYFAKHGYVTAAIVMRGFNETADKQDRGVNHVTRSCLQVTMSSYLMGMTTLGLRCWDAMRVIDFLQSQEVVDPDKIGLAGLSGGGAVAMYLPVLEKRIKVAMIAGAFTAFRSTFYATPHCMCQCLPGIMQYGEMSDIVALCAPRPVLLINGTGDTGFPIEDARIGYEKLKRVYSLQGVGENVEADFFEGGHRWSNNKTLDFLAKHFQNPKSKISE